MDKLDKSPKLSHVTMGTVEHDSGFSRLQFQSTKFGIASRDGERLWWKTAYHDSGSNEVRGNRPGPAEPALRPQPTWSAETIPRLQTGHGLQNTAPRAVSPSSFPPHKFPGYPDFGRDFEGLLPPSQDYGQNTSSTRSNTPDNHAWEEDEQPSQGYDSGVGMWLQPGASLAFGGKINSTISKNNTGGECGRQELLFADMARRKSSPMKQTHEVSTHPPSNVWLQQGRPILPSMDIVSGQGSDMMHDEQFLLQNGIDPSLLNPDQLAWFYQQSLSVKQKTIERYTRHIEALHRQQSQQTSKLVPKHINPPGQDLYLSPRFYGSIRGFFPPASAYNTEDVRYQNPSMVNADGDNSTSPVQFRYMVPREPLELSH